MNPSDLPQLAIDTLKDPRGVAQRLIALKIPSETLWMGFGLIIVLNTLVYFVALATSPLGMQGAAMMPLPLQSPILFAFLLGGMLVMTVHAIYWTGSAMSGTAALGDILVLMTWLQTLRLALQIALFVVHFLSPGLAAMVSMVLGIWGLWILINFIDVAHGFGSPLKALSVLMAASFALFFGLVLMITLIGLVATNG
jgi:hypothetical protein